jgi:hypothetical protein
LNNGFPLLTQDGELHTVAWPGGEGVVAPRGLMDGASIRLEWTAERESAFTPIGVPLVTEDTLGEPFVVPAGFLRMAVSGRTSNTVAIATAYRIPTHFVRGPF